MLSDFSPKKVSSLQNFTFPTKKFSGALVQDNKIIVLFSSETADVDYFYC